MNLAFILCSPLRQNENILYRESLEAEEDTKQVEYDLFLGQNCI